MKIGYATALLFLFTTPALPSNTQTDSGVTFTCALTGSDDSGFDIYAKNDGATDKSCTAKCKLSKSSGGAQEWEYSATVRASAQRFWFGGEAGVSGAPLSNPDLTSASCH